MRNRMTFPKISFALGALLGVALGGQPLLAATIVIDNLDGAGEGLNDTTAVAAVGGNPGLTLGEQRLNVFNRGAAIWGAALASNVTIVIEANFDPQFCTPTSAVLGSAGPKTAHRNFAGGVPDTWYAAALANKLNGADIAAATADAGSTFNSDLDDDPNCLGGIGWYYGYDHIQGGSIDFLGVVLHELAHTLGFLTFVDKNTGVELGAVPGPDIYERYMFDTSTAKNWVDMSNAERATSATNTKAVVWDGPVVAHATDFLSSGKIGDNPMLYTPNPVEPGSSLSHWAKNAFPNLLMEPSITPGITNDLDLTEEAFADMGWTVPGACCMVFDGSCWEPTIESGCLPDAFTPGVACIDLAPACAAPSDQARMIVLLDRTGSMKAKRFTGNTRCHDALAQAVTDVSFFLLGNQPDRRAAIWTFANNTVTDHTGFVELGPALTALSGLTTCFGNTPLAQAICTAVDAFPLGLPAGDKILAISSDGRENASAGSCAGTNSVSGPPPPGNYDFGSWQENVYNKIQDPLVTTLVRYWAAFAVAAGAEFDGEDPASLAAATVSDAVFFRDIAEATGGPYIPMPDGVPSSQALEACCIQEFAVVTCEDLPEEDCIVGGGTPQGPGTECLDDLDFNGRDDACEDCGDGVCRASENPCNCPEDCGEPAGRRILSDPNPTYCLGVRKRISIVITPPAGTQAMGLEDKVPVGWEVSNISDDGFFDATTGKVKIGKVFLPFPGGPVKLWGYDVIPQPGFNSTTKCFDGLTSADGFNTTTCGEQCIELAPSCPCLAIPADARHDPCEGCAGCDVATCEDGRVEMSEVIGYACQFAKGCHDNQPAVARAAFLWQEGGGWYCRNGGGQGGCPLPCPPDPGPLTPQCCPAAGSVASALTQTSSETIAVARIVSADKKGSGKPRAPRERVQQRRIRQRALMMSITIDAPPWASVVVLSYHVPKGWEVRDISDAGQWDAIHRKVKWGPFMNDLSRTVTFRVRALVSNAPMDDFFGMVSIDGILNQSIALD